MTERDELRAAFDADFADNPARPGLRERALRRAREEGEPIPGRSRWWLPVRLGPVVALAIAAAAGVAYLNGPAAPHTSGGNHVQRSPQFAAFGRVPAPSLALPQGLGAGGAGEPYLYFGPAALTWEGTLPAVPATAPVFRYTVSDAALQAFANHVGATPVPAPKGPDGASYLLAGGLRMDVSRPDPQHGIDGALYRVNAPRDVTGAPASDSASRAAADQFLRSLGLAPAWPARVSVMRVITPSHVVLPTQVVYQRLFNLPGGLVAGAVNREGDPYGAMVVVDSRGPAGAIGDVPLLPEAQADYPIQRGSGVVAQALASLPLDPYGPDGTRAAPTVRLTSATLVYMQVAAGENGYFVPAYLFTGQFQAHGSTYEKRIIVPALTADQLR